MHKRFSLLAAIAGTACVGLIPQSAAKTTFLPDWQRNDLNFENNEGNFNRDEPLCIEAVDAFGNKLYHKADSCPAPKVFDEYCAHDDRYISECYCPEIYQYTCTSPYRGDERVKDKGYASCDGLYIHCCNETCPSGTTRTDPGGCGGSTTNDCGDTCYYPYQPCCYPASDETGCSCGSYTCDDGCGGYRNCCSACPEPEPEPEPSSSGIDSSSSSSSSGSSSSSSSSGSGNSSSSSSGSGSSSSSSSSGGSDEENTCVSGGSASCTGKSSCASNEESTGSCKDCSGKTLYTCKTKTCTVKTCGYSSKPSGKYNCTACTGQRADCTTYSGWNCTKYCTDTCAQWRNAGCRLNGTWNSTSSTDCSGNGGGTGEGCTDYGCNSLWYCCGK